MAKLGEHYLSSQLITYMGNKRKLLPIISSIVDKLQKELGKEYLIMGDGFSGSGCVSRLFKTKAGKLYTNDLAGYSKTVSECYLATPDDEMVEKIKGYIDAIPTVALTQEELACAAPEQQSELPCAAPPRPPEQQSELPWISGQWSPLNPIITADDRVYFTYENGKRIDLIRNYIETIPIEYRSFVLAPLLVECSIHNNTNGQFSAFYKDETATKGEYGGKKGIDVKRIKQAIKVPYPIFDAHPCQVIISQMDTNTWAKETELDIVYYDPPYNKHPYNIYYFLLDIINNWDKTLTIPDTNRGQPDDRTKSLYNSMSKAKDALDDLISNTKAKYIILSYNDGGIIPIPVVDELLAKHASSVEKIPIDHKTYNRLKGISNYKRTSEYKPVKEFIYVITTL
jgi:adenine-specific DNA-methyltransferase